MSGQPQAWLRGARGGAHGDWPDEAAGWAGAEWEAIGRMRRWAGWARGDWRDAARRGECAAPGLTWVLGQAGGSRGHGLGARWCFGLLRVS